MHGASLELFQVSWLSVSNNIYKCWQITYFQGQLVKGKQKRCRKVGSRLFWEGINVWNVNQNWFSPDSPQLFGWLVASQWINSFKKSISHVLPTCPWFSWVPDVNPFFFFFNLFQFHSRSLSLCKDVRMLHFQETSNQRHWFVLTLHWMTADEAHAWLLKNSLRCVFSLLEWF